MRGSERFYDELAPRYDAAILRCVPRYAEMLHMLLAHVPDDLAPRRILELGSGSGHLTRATLGTFPEARVVAVDVSREMLLECRRTTDATRVECVRADFDALPGAAGAFDLVVSSIAIHHVDDTVKPRLFECVHACLRPGGVFAYSDQFRGDTDEIYAKHLRAWHDEARALGTDEDEWATWMRHQEEHDHHATLRDQLGWLEAVGFATVDGVWRYLLWTVLVARKADTASTFPG